MCVKGKIAGDLFIGMLIPEFAIVNNNGEGAAYNFIVYGDGNLSFRKELYQPADGGFPPLAAFHICIGRYHRFFKVQVIFRC